MARRAVISLAVAWAVGCGTAETFCPPEPLTCEGASCADAGTPEPESCIGFDQAAELASAGGHGIVKLSTSVDPAHYGFITATSQDSRSTCHEGICYMMANASVALSTIGENQTIFLGWSGCNTSADTHFTVTAKDKDIACTAHYTPAWILVQASSTGWTDAPVHVVASSGCDGTNGCNVFYAGDVTFTAPTSPDYTFVGWSGCSTSTAPTLTLSHVTTTPAACVAQYRPATP